MARSAHRTWRASAECSDTFPESHAGPAGKKAAASAHRHATQAGVSGPLPVPRREIAAVRRLHVRRQIARVVEWQRTRLAQHFEVGTLARRFQIRFGTFDFLGV